MCHTDFAGTTSFSGRMFSGMCTCLHSGHGHTMYHFFTCRLCSQRVPRSAPDVGQGASMYRLKMISSFPAPG